MPRGDNPNSRANLKPNTRANRTKKEQREIASKGGRASGVSRRALKSFKELDDEFTTDDERKKMLDILKKRAQQGNIKAFEVYRDTIGLKPAEKVIVADVDQEAIDEVEKIVNEWNGQKEGC